MATIPEALALALRHHREGKLSQAEEIYRAILAAEPKHADATHFLGVIAHQGGKHNIAAQHIRRAIALNSKVPAYFNNLGEVYRALSLRAEAAECYRRALALKPDYVGAHRNLAGSLRELGRIDDAIASYRELLRLSPPDAGAMLGELGELLCRQGKWEEAVACFRQAIEPNPNDPQAHTNLGVALNSMGQAEEAIACYRAALRFAPDVSATHLNLGVALANAAQPEAAAASFQRAVALSPDLPEAHNNLGNVLRNQGKLTAALSSLRRAVELRPDYADALMNLGALLGTLMRPGEAMACYRRALEANPRHVAAHSNLLLTAHYREHVTLASLADLHAEFNRRHAAPLRSKPLARAGHARTEEQPLRLGFVSPNLGRHPVGYWLVRFFEHIDRQVHEVVCYSDRREKDDLTQRIQSAAHEWNDVRGLGDEQLAEKIRSDRIDILFDLAGHTAENRLLVFARKPAPIQITWAGYVGTTGLTAIDYLLADPHLVPAGAEKYYAERILRLPDGHVCHEPPDFAPPVSHLPALTEGRVTFGCFNNPAKLNHGVIGLWAKILRRVPDSRLVLKYRDMDEPSLRGQISEWFAGHGVDAGRLEFLGGSPHAESLAAYHRIDLALDSFPFSGGLTTCDALWMGVPVVTWPGETFASRQSMALMANVGRHETIARDQEHYLSLAVELAGDLPRLADVRAGLRDQMAASPLCDGKKFAQNFAQLVRQVRDRD